MCGLLRCNSASLRSMIFVQAQLEHLELFEETGSK
jgi:hypothetical protein